MPRGHTQCGIDFACKRQVVGRVVFKDSNPETQRFACYSHMKEFITAPGTQIIRWGIK